MYVIEPTSFPPVKSFAVESQISYFVTNSGFVPRDHAAVTDVIWMVQVLATVRGTSAKVADVIYDVHGLEDPFIMEFT